LQSVLKGASLGRAALEARQKFIHNANMTDGYNIKTIARFNLYGDASLTPVKVAHAAVPVVASAKAKGVVSAIAEQLERTARRRDLFSRGLALAKSQPTLRKVAETATETVMGALEKLAKAQNMTPTQTLTFDVKEPATAKSMPQALLAKAALPSRVHMIFDTSGDATAKGKSAARAADTKPGTVINITALVVEEVNGQLVSAKKIFSR